MYIYAEAESFAVMGVPFADELTFRLRDDGMQKHFPEEYGESIGVLDWDMMRHDGA